MTDDDPTPRCVLCNQPAIMGVGTAGDRDAEAWYCNNHINAAHIHAAQPVPGWPLTEPRRSLWQRLTGKQ